MTLSRVLQPSLDLKDINLRGGELNSSMSKVIQIKVAF